MMAERKYLSLEKKVNLIEYTEKHPKLGVRAIAECFEIGQTQVSDIHEDKLACS